jgi:hypothetical protein
MVKAIKETDHLKDFFVDKISVDLKKLDVVRIVWLRI